MFFLPPSKYTILKSEIALLVHFQSSHPTEQLCNFTFPDFYYPNLQNSNFVAINWASIFCHQVFVSLCVCFCLFLVHVCDSFSICLISYVSLKWIGLAPIILSYVCVFFCLSLFFIATLSHFLCFSICLLPGPSSLLPSLNLLASPFTVISFHFILPIQSVFLFTLAPSLPFSMSLCRPSSLSPSPPLLLCLLYFSFSQLNFFPSLSLHLNHLHPHSLIVHYLYISVSPFGSSHHCACYGCHGVYLRMVK